MQWYHVLSGCESYWKMQYRKLHNLPAEEIPEGVSLKALTVATLAFEAKIQSLKIIKMKEIAVKSEESVISTLPAGTSRYWFYYCCRAGIALTYTPKGAIKSSIVFTVANTKALHLNTTVVWSWSVCDGVLFYGSMGVWVFVPYPDVSDLESKVVQSFNWQDEIHSPAHFQLGGCTNCRLIVEAKKSVNDEHKWALDIITLLDKFETAQRTSLSFKFLPESPDPFLKIRCVSLLPCSPSCTDSCLCELFCEEHYLLIQIGNGVLIYILKCTQGDTFLLSGPVHSLCPSGSSWVEIAPALPSKFCTSLDGSLVAVLAGHTLTVWNLKNLTEYSCRISGTSNILKLFVISVGTLYSVIGLEFPNSKVEIRILSTTSGRQINQFVVSLIDSARLRMAFSSGWVNSTGQSLELPFELCVSCFDYPQRLFLRSPKRTYIMLLFK